MQLEEKKMHNVLSIPSKHQYKSAECWKKCHLTTNRVALLFLLVFWVVPLGFLNLYIFFWKQKTFPADVFALQPRMAEQRYCQTVCNGGLSFAVWYLGVVRSIAWQMIHCCLITHLRYTLKDSFKTFAMFPIALKHQCFCS